MVGRGKKSKNVFLKPKKRLEISHFKAFFVFYTEGVKLKSIGNSNELKKIRLLLALFYILLKAIKRRIWK